MDFEKMNLKDLLEERESRFKKATELRDKAKGDKRDLTSDEASNCDGLLADVRKIDGLIDEKRKADQTQQSEQRDQAFGELESRTHAPATPPARGPEPNNRDMFDGSNDWQNYSLMRAIKLRASGRPLDGYEGEVSQELAKRSGKDPQGFLIPWDLPVEVRGRSGAERRALNVTGGAGAIPTVLATTMIDLLRNSMVVQRMGARVINNLVGEMDIPKKTGGGNSYWLGEDGEPTESGQTIGQVQLRVKTIGAYTDITRRFMNQTSLDAEMFVRQDLVQVLALEMDRAALNGSGANNQPTGLLQQSGLPLVSIGTDGGAITWQKIVDLESTIKVSNADENALAYLTSSTGRGAMKSIQKFANTGRTLWGDDNTVNGYNAVSTNQLPTDLTKGTGTDLVPLIFGDFSSLILGFWSGLDVMIDPYSKSKSGGVRVVGLQDTDVAIRHIESFAAIVDFDPTVLS